MPAWLISYSSFFVFRNGLGSEMMIRCKTMTSTMFTKTSLKYFRHYALDNDIIICGDKKLSSVNVNLNLVNNKIRMIFPGTFFERNFNYLPCMLYPDLAKTVIFSG